jgi:hypothetical protein
MAEIEGQPGRPGQPQPRRSFTEEFKREAVRLAIERDNVSAVAETSASTRASSAAGSVNSSKKQDNQVQELDPFRAVAMPVTRR